MHADRRCVILFHEIFFHGDQSVALHSVRGSIGERDARYAFGGGLDQVALIECKLIVGVCPSDRINFLHLNFAVEVDEASLARTDGCDAACRAA